MHQVFYLQMVGEATMDYQIWVTTNIFVWIKPKVFLTNMGFTLTELKVSGVLQKEDQRNSMASNLILCYIWSVSGDGRDPHRKWKKNCKSAKLIMENAIEISITLMSCKYYNRISNFIIIFDEIKNLIVQSLINFGIDLFFYNICNLLINYFKF